MFNVIKKYTIPVCAVSAAVFSLIYFTKQNQDLPLVAIANYGPHSSLETSITGLKEELGRQGFVENETIRYSIADVGFDSSLIAQMIIKMKNLRPKVMIVLTTPVAQSAKNLVKDIPLVFDVITDPVEAGLLKKEDEPEENMTGTSDKPDLKLVLAFIRELLPKARKIGLLYSTAEANDAALVKMMKAAAAQMNIEIMAVPVDQPPDVPMRIQAFKGHVDAIYVGVSGPIQPTLPVIASEANKMNIPVFNADVEAVREHQVLGSLSIDYYQTGVNTADIVAKILKGEKIKNLKPIHPGTKDHHGLISKKNAERFHIMIPSTLINTKVGR